MGNRSRACDITGAVKRKVWERDEGKCVVCGCTSGALPNAHYISRANGGLGIEQNIVTLCGDFTASRCHYRYDNGGAAERAELGVIIEEHLKAHYPGWDKDKLIYRK